MENIKAEDLHNPTGGYCYNGDVHNIATPREPVAWLKHKATDTMISVYRRINRFQRYFLKLCFGLEYIEIPTEEVFDYKKARSGAQVRTVNGYKVDILKWNAKGKFCIEGTIHFDQCDKVEEWTKKGKYSDVEGHDDCWDLTTRE